MRNPDELLTIPELAAELKISRQSLYIWLRSGQVEGLKAGRQWRVARRAVTAYLERNMQPSSHKA